MAGSTPLQGQRIVVTRAPEQAAGLVRRFEEFGAHIIAFETIAIQYSADFKPLLTGKTFDWIVLTSANGVRALAHAAERENKSLAALRPCRFFAVGPSTAESLQEYGVDADLLPDEFVAEGGVEALRSVEPKWEGKRVLFACAKGARRIIPDALRGWGAEVESRVLYETVKPAVDEQRVAALTAAEPNWLTFTSGSTATNFAAIVGQSRIDALLETAAIASIGPQTSAACAAAGMPVTVEAVTHDSAGLAQAIVDYVTREDT